MNSIIVPKSGAWKQRVGNVKPAGWPGRPSKNNNETKIALNKLFPEGLFSALLEKTGLFSPRDKNAVCETRARTPSLRAHWTTSADQRSFCIFTARSQSIRGISNPVSSVCLYLHSLACFPRVLKCSGQWMILILIKNINVYLLPNGLIKILKMLTIFQLNLFYEFIS